MVILQNISHGAKIIYSGDAGTNCVIIYTLTNFRTNVPTEVLVH